MRFFTASPVVSRETSKEVEIGGYILPKVCAITLIIVVFENLIDRAWMDKYITYYNKIIGKVHINIPIYIINRILQKYCRVHGFGLHLGSRPKIPRTFQTLMCSGQKDLILLAMRRRQGTLMLIYQLGWGLARKCPRREVCSATGQVGCHSLVP